MWSASADVGVRLFAAIGRAGCGRAGRWRGFVGVGDFSPRLSMEPSADWFQCGAARMASATSVPATTGEVRWPRRERSAMHHAPAFDRAMNYVLSTGTGFRDFRLPENDMVRRLGLSQHYPSSTSIFYHKRRRVAVRAIYLAFFALHRVMISQPLFPATELRISPEPWITGHTPSLKTNISSSARLSWKPILVCACARSRVRKTSPLRHGVRRQAVAKLPKT